MDESAIRMPFSAAARWPESGRFRGEEMLQSELIPHPSDSHRWPKERTQILGDSGTGARFAADSGEPYRYLLQADTRQIVREVDGPFRQCTLGRTR